MARSIIGGLLGASDHAPTIQVADPNPEQLAALRERWPEIMTGRDNAALAAAVDVLVLAVKPQVLGEVARGLAPTLATHRPLIVSIAAGVRTADLERWLGPGLAIVRCMPNTPALVCSGASALYANAATDAAQREAAERILRAVGVTVWCAEEQELDAVTALSGSGPAYFLLVMEAMEAAARKLGLSPEAARLLTLETAFGTAKLALESAEGAAELRAHVTSKGGTTERAVQTLEEAGIRKAFEDALEAAAHRSRELGDALGAD
jgi:pyrroline-5-carboxylate reductase